VVCAPGTPGEQLHVEGQAQETVSDGALHQGMESREGGNYGEDPEILAGRREHGGLPNRALKPLSTGEWGRLFSPVNGMDEGLRTPASEPKTNAL